jgi:hypothetical protein
VGRHAAAHPTPITPGAEQKRRANHAGHRLHRFYDPFLTDEHFQAVQVAG